MVYYAVECKDLNVLYYFSSSVLLRDLNIYCDKIGEFMWCRTTMSWMDCMHEWISSLPDSELAVLVDSQYGNLFSKYMGLQVKEQCFSLFVAEIRLILEPQLLPTLEAANHTIGTVLLVRAILLASLTDPLSIIGLVQ